MVVLRSPAAKATTPRTWTPLMSVEGPGFWKVSIRVSPMVSTGALQINAGGWQFATNEA